MPVAERVLRCASELAVIHANTSGITNLRIMEMGSALNGRRLCENTVGLLEEKGVSHWTSAGAVDKTEWVSQVRTVTTIFGPYQLQEGLHASYWGQLAMRNCLRQAYGDGDVLIGSPVTLHDVGRLVVSVC